jgi:hypothetical protein
MCFCSESAVLREKTVQELCFGAFFNSRAFTCTCRFTAGLPRGRRRFQEHGPSREHSISTEFLEQTSSQSCCQTAVLLRASVAARPPLAQQRQACPLSLCLPHRPTQLLAAHEDLAAHAYQHQVLPLLSPQTTKQPNTPPTSASRNVAVPGSGSDPVPVGCSSEHMQARDSS